MNNDYLWDRTGEPDAEIQRLEEILGALRYEPRQLAIPAQLRPRRRRMFFPRLAIAAAIAMMVVAAGLWFSLSHQNAAQFHEASTFPAWKSNDGLTLVARPNPLPPRKAPHLGLHSDQSARNIPARRKPTASPAEMTSGELAEAEEAKERLMLALRVATTKLSLAQRKAQGAPAANTIRNQHRIG